jgi:hypothetical protein
MNQEKTEQILKALNETEITPEEKEDFVWILAHVPKDQYDDICDLVIKRPWIAAVIVDNYEAKKEYFSSGDEKKMEEILTEEKELVARAEKEALEEQPAENV